MNLENQRVTRWTLTNANRYAEEVPTGHTLEVVNYLSYAALTELYVSPSWDSYWGDNWLYSPIFPYESMVLTVDAADYYDILAIDEYGIEHSYWGVYVEGYTSVGIEDSYYEGDYYEGEWYGYAMGAAASAGEKVKENFTTKHIHTSTGAAK